MPHDLISSFAPPRNKSWRRHWVYTHVNSITADEPVLGAIDTHGPLVGELSVTILGASQSVEASEGDDYQGQ